MPASISSIRPSDGAANRNRKLTKSEVELRAAEAAYADDPERQNMVAIARRFKASWFELGEALLASRKSERWRDWGHKTFEDYCTKELHLKRETVEKLTGSYAFLKARAPEVLNRDARRAPLPSYQAVDFWRRAEEEATDAPPEVLAELRERVIENGESLPSLSRVYKPVLFPVDEETALKDGRQRLANMVKRMSGMLEDMPSLLSRRLTAELKPLLERIGERLEKQTEKDDAEGEDE